MVRKTDAEYDEMSWHDSFIHGFSMDQTDLRSDLVIDIDHIVDWRCEEERTEFLISPASLTFHDVTDLRLVIDWGESGYIKSVFGMYIIDIYREMVETKMRFERYYRWIIELNDSNSSIAMGASGYTHFQRKEPIWVDRQGLTKDQRA